MGESDDEPDYMSDDFLAKCVPEDVRPGLKRSHADLRQHEMSKKKAETERTRGPGLRCLEVSKREEGLDTCLDATNKGFAMLQKMGYKAGSSLGRSDSGITEPIRVQVKANREGLGRETVLKEVAEAKKQLLRQRLCKQPPLSTEQFRAQFSAQRKLKQVEIDLYKSQRACRQLDLAKDVDSPAEKWFWPSSQQDDGDNDEHLSEAEQDKIEQRRLDEEAEHRDSDSAEGSDAEASQPISTLPQGLVPADHPTTASGSSATDEDCFSSEEQLSLLTGYLRSAHWYCLWCGQAFQNSDDLERNCPGPNRQDHDDDNN